MSELQKEFEEWAQKQFHLLDKSAGGRYSHASTEWAWQAWQAATELLIMDAYKRVNGVSDE